MSIAATPRRHLQRLTVLGRLGVGGNAPASSGVKWYTETSLLTDRPVLMDRRALDREPKFCLFVPPVVYPYKFFF